MVVKLFGHDNQIHDFEIGELADIDHADMWVYDGREYLVVTYKNGETITYSDDTVHGHCDGGYPVYYSDTGFNMLVDDMWLAEKNAGDRMI